ncbi:hypothetical protein J2X98_003130 [Pseudarthrobacter enclensis]|uniref:Uncharacterized protein n=1 Tax=Pseudarthrobacter enclensis TaxID=993070 RepID=A0ABT9RWA5_9MICC|nr:hypothetical protein [Pseudarthrobacter enclensis]
MRAGLVPWTSVNGPTLGPRIDSSILGIGPFFIHSERGEEKSHPFLAWVNEFLDSYKTFCI